MLKKLRLLLRLVWDIIPTCTIVFKLVQNPVCRTRRCTSRAGSGRRWATSFNCR